ncbi:MAG: helical backbone metal receptor [Candidatus Cloacimonetes bacterium]|nr:helical backbone metal receptor [Candidatus Cloacimonadota bacterium]
MKLLLPTLLIFLLLSCTMDNNQAKHGVVITSPEAAEMYVAIAGVKNILAVTDECNFPPELKQKPSIGKFGTVSFERIINLQPELVITTDLEQASLNEKLKKLGISTLVLYPQRISEISEAMITLGKETGFNKQAEQVATTFKAVLDSLEMEHPYRPRVYVEIYGVPLMSVSDSSLVGDIISFAGGDNIFASLPRPYSRIKPEAVIDAAPDIILICYPGQTVENIIARKGWDTIPACINGRIYTLNDFDVDLILRGGPRVIEGIRQLRKLFFLQ